MEGEDKPPPIFPIGQEQVALDGFGAAYREETKAAYSALWRQFERECQVLRSFDDKQAYLETLYDLLLRYTWCVPSAYYRAVPDVSLFDHGRTTAALNVCLTLDGRTGDWCRAVREALRQGQQDGPATQEICLLVGADLSGVQDYLYTLASSGAAKSLRGRSFYLQLLTEIAAYKVLDDLGLPIANLLYVGGGNFYLLAPLKHRAELERLREEIGRALLDAHGGALYMSLGYISVRAYEFQRGVFGACWERVNHVLSRLKRRRYADLDDDTLASVVGAPLAQGGHPDRTCSICDREHPEGKEWPKDEVDDEVRKCKLCASLEDLGRMLPRTEHLAVLRMEGPVTQGHEVHAWRDGLQALGYRVYLLPGEREALSHVEGIQFVRLLRLQPEPDEPFRAPWPGLDHVPVAAAYRPQVKLVPYIAGNEIATFDQLAQASQGVERWGVLRMDVDDLGELFRTGLGDRATLSRVASLSFFLRLFFEGRLSAIGRKYNARTGSAVEAPGVTPGRDKVYAMYAGGDDVFIVGAWDALPHLAHDIRTEFTRFVAGNPQITLSGGISLAAEKFPLYQAARQAGAAERLAKGMQRRPAEQRYSETPPTRPDGGPWEKDALAFLGYPLAWELFDEVWDRVAKLWAWCGPNGSAPRALIQTLRAIDSEYRRGLERQRRERAAGRVRPIGQFYYGPWMWRLTYQLTRMAEEARRGGDGREEIARWIEELRDRLVEPDGPIVLIGLIARWAELLVRERKEA